MDVYPIFLIGLRQQRCIVIGGGAEATRKVRGLLDAAAAVTVISKEVTDELRAWIDAGTVSWIPRAYLRGDLRGAFLVVVTAQDSQTIARLWEEAQAEKALINVMDDAAHSTFIAGAVVRQGPLTVAISTGGHAPALAVRLRQRLERELGPEYAALLALLEKLRQPLARYYPDFAQRRARWYALLDSDLLALLRAGHTELARQRLATLVGEEVLRALPEDCFGKPGNASP